MSFTDFARQDKGAALAPVGIPELPLCFVERPRLDLALADLLTGARAVVCVWGAAGSGKSTVLASWARRLIATGNSVQWLAVSERQNASAELQRLFTAPVSLADTNPAAYVFVDDAHRLSSGSRAALYRLLEQLPDGVRVVLSGRFQPIASLAFLEAEGALCELRTAELAFDVAETMQLASRHGISLSEHSVGALVERTGGWVTALALAMPWIESSSVPDEAIERFGVNQRAVAYYLASEVLRGLSTEERVVLLAAAIAECVPVELLSELSGRADAGKIMHKLSRRNSLITEESGDYRLHPVLLGLMKAELRRQDAAGATRNHRAAAKWYAHAGDGAAALEHAAASGDSAMISGVLDQCGLELVLAGRSDAVRWARWNAAPQEEPLSSIVVKLLMQAPYAVDARQARHLFVLANQRLSSEQASGAWALALLATSCFRAAPEPALREKLRALAAPAAQKLRDNSLALDLLAATAEGWCFDQLGDSLKAIDLYRDVADAAHGAGFTWLYLLTTDLAVACLSARGEWLHASALEDRLGRSAQKILASAGSRAAAGAAILVTNRSYQRCEPISEEFLDAVIEADPLGINFGMLVPALMLRELPALDNSEQLRGAAERVERVCREAGHHFPRLLAAACVRLVSSRLALDGHEMAKSFVDFSQGVLGADSLEVMTARYLLHPPNHVGDSAERNLESALRADARAWHAGAAISAWIVLAQTAHDTGRNAEADARIMRAVRLAEQFQTPRPFLARGGEGVALVEARLGRFGPLESAAEHIVGCGSALLVRDLDERHLIEPLTPREREILLELPVHQSVAEIARKQTLSVNTVKTHLRNIYQKLSASGRSDAVRIAHQHHLL